MNIRYATQNDVVDITKLFYELEILHHRMDRTNPIDTLSECWLYGTQLFRDPNVDVKVIEVNDQICGYYVAKTVYYKNGKSVRIGKTAYVKSTNELTIHDIMKELLMDLYFGNHYDVCVAHNVYKINKGIVNMYLNDFGFKILKEVHQHKRTKYTVVKYN